MDKYKTKCSLRIPFTCDGSVAGCENSICIFYILLLAKFLTSREFTIFLMSSLGAETKLKSTTKHCRAIECENIVIFLHILREKKVNLKHCPSTG